MPVEKVRALEDLAAFAYLMPLPVGQLSSAIEKMGLFARRFVTRALEYKIAQNALSLARLQEQVAPFPFRDPDRLIQKAYDEHGQLLDVYVKYRDLYCQGADGTDSLSFTAAKNDAFAFCHSLRERTPTERCDLLAKALITYESLAHRQAMQDLKRHYFHERENARLFVEKAHLRYARLSRLALVNPFTFNKQKGCFEYHPMNQDEAQASMGHLNHQRLIERQNLEQRQRNLVEILEWSANIDAIDAHLHACYEQKRTFLEKKSC